MRRRLYTLAYPELDPSDRAWIDAVRDEHDVSKKDLVAPHFTLVFQCDDVDEQAYLKQVETISHQLAPIGFHCRYAMISADPHREIWYAFLVPDEGNGAISKLHDQLYRGVLASSLSLAFDFVPHITIATKRDALSMKQLCDHLNRDRISIAGRIERLAVVALAEDSIEEVAVFPLLG